MEFEPRIPRIYSSILDMVLHKFSRRESSRKALLDKNLFVHCVSGDSSSIVSAVCYTVPRSAKGSSVHALESGSDFKSRGMSNENRVVLGPGVTMTTCDVKLIDDSVYEEEEEFEIALADASENARIGSISSAKVMINGPNDASTVSLGNATFTVSEDAGKMSASALFLGC